LLDSSLPSRVGCSERKILESTSLFPGILA
jgi:hypothetical protein